MIWQRQLRQSVQDGVNIMSASLNRKIRWLPLVLAIVIAPGAHAADQSKQWDEQAVAVIKVMSA
jgi:hypothetical protein